MLDSFWNWFAIIVTIASILACWWLLHWTKGISNRQEDEIGDTGHVWDHDVRELNNPLPRWWLHLFNITIVFSFLCSLWEAALLSITPTYAEIKQQEGAAVGRHLTEFKENIDRPLAAILTLNTIAHTVGAIGVGAQATIIWADAHPLITSALVPVVMTLAILLFSEIVPFLVNNFTLCFLSCQCVQAQNCK